MEFKISFKGLLVSALWLIIGCFSWYQMSTVSRNLNDDNVHIFIFWAYLVITSILFVFKSYTFIKSKKKIKEISIKELFLSDWIFFIWFAVVYLITLSVSVYYVWRYIDSVWGIENFQYDWLVNSVFNLAGLALIIYMAYVILRTAYLYARNLKSSKILDRIFLFKEK